MFLLLQSLLFSNSRTRHFLGIMPAQNKTATGMPTRPGIIGFFQDRLDYIILAKNTYLAESAERAKQFSNLQVDNNQGRDIKYETKRKGPADRKAAAAGKIEKL
jgi:hypothetical protein